MTARHFATKGPSVVRLEALIACQGHGEPLPDWRTAVVAGAMASGACAPSRGDDGGVDAGVEQGVRGDVFAGEGAAGGCAEPAGHEKIIEWRMITSVKGS